jgi:GGDEF domain-containing protein
MISRECRDGDALVRSGADEFALVLPGSPIEAGTATARRVVNAIADWGHEDGVTVSAGVAAVSSQSSADVFRVITARVPERSTDSSVSGPGPA